MIQHQEIDQDSYLVNYLPIKLPEQFFQLVLLFIKAKITLRFVKKCLDTLNISRYKIWLFTLKKHLIIMSHRFCRSLHQSRVDTPSKKQLL